MAEKYYLEFVVKNESKKDWLESHDILDSSELSFRLGEHSLFELVVSTPQGHKRVTITAKVEKYPYR